ncbi:ABC transporter permease [Paenibacillus castaneae]
MLVPGIILVLIFSYGSMFGIIMAFQNFVPSSGFFDSKWVGLEHFKFMVQLPDFRNVLWNTFFIAMMKIAAGLLLPVTIAILLNEVMKQWYKRFIQVVIYAPYFLSWVILGGILFQLLSIDGIVNQFLGLFGVEPILFLGKPSIFPYVLVASDTWKNMGFNTIVFLAAITNVDPTLHEAGAIDGANRWKQIWNITLPGMFPIIILVATLSLGDILNAGFEQVLMLYGPALYKTGDIIDTYVYRIGLINGQYSFAAAVGLFKSMVSLVMVSLSYYLAYRLANYRIF